MVYNRDSFANEPYCSELPCSETELTAK